MSTAAPDIIRAEGMSMTAEQARAVAPMRVGDIDAVARSRLLTVGVETPLAEVAALLSDSQITLVLVCDESDDIAGVITETILVRQLGFGQADVFSTRAGEVMTREFTACGPADSLTDVLAMMNRHGLIHVLVVDDQNKSVGVLTARDALSALLVAGNQEESLLRNYVMGVGYQ
jgi:CBS domain-containing protein